MHAEHTNKILVRTIFSQNLREASATVLAEYFAPEYQNYAAPPGVSRGADGMMQLDAMLHTAFPDFRFEVLEVVAEGELVIARVMAHGTHLGPFQGLAPSGRAFQLDSFHMFRCVDGKAVEHWAVRDDLGMLRQLGAAPTPVPAPATTA